MEPYRRSSFLKRVLTRYFGTLHYELLLFLYSVCVTMSRVTDYRMYTSKMCSVVMNKDVSPNNLVFAVPNLFSFSTRSNVTDVTKNDLKECENWMNRTNVTIEQLLYEVRSRFNLNKI